MLFSNSFSPWSFSEDFGILENIIVVGKWWMFKRLSTASIICCISLCIFICIAFSMVWTEKKQMKSLILFSVQPNFFIIALIIWKVQISHLETYLCWIQFLNKLHFHYPTFLSLLLIMERCLFHKKKQKHCKCPNRLLIY